MSEHDTSAESPPRSRRRILRWIAIALLSSILVIVAAYLRDIGQAYARITDASSVLAVAADSIEFVEGGSGQPVLVVHGSGGGFDQGRLIADAVVGDSFRWVAPSRFGYLRSTLPDGATFDAQAHTYALLLDRLGIARTAVVALSHGCPSALLFAVHYPERVSSLVLISCGVASSTAAEQAAASERGNTLTTIFRYDPLYWGVSRGMRKTLMGLMGADDAVIAQLTREQRTLVDRVIDYMNPVAPRSAGVGLDNRAAMPNERIGAITAPTLIVHAVDDGLQLYRNAEFAMATIPGAQLRRFEHGGHLLIAVEQQEIRSATQRFIREHSDR